MLHSSQTTDAGPPARDKQIVSSRVSNIDTVSFSSHSERGTEQRQSLPDTQEVSKELVGLLSLHASPAVSQIIDFLHTTYADVLTRFVKILRKH